MAEDLSKIPEIPPISPDSSEVELVDFSEDLEAFEWRIKILEVERQEHELSAERAMLGQRRWYAFLLFGLISIWLAFIAVIIFMTGCDYHPNLRVNLWFFHIHFPASDYKLSDSVLIALISTTTINVLGLFYIVARWLFPQAKNSEKPPKEDKKPTVITVNST